MDNWIHTIASIRATRLLKTDAILQRIPIVYISVNNDLETLSNQAGAEAFTTKPLNFDKLLN